MFFDDFVCVVDRDNAAVGDTLTIEQYLALPHNTVKLGRPVLSIIEQGWRRAGLTPRVVATTTSFASLIFMVPGTPLIATAQRRLATRLARMLPIRLVECPVPIPALDEDVVWHARNELDPAHRFVREAFVAAAAAMG